MGLAVVQGGGAKVHVPTYTGIVSIILTEQKTYRDVGCVDA